MYICACVLRHLGTSLAAELAPAEPLSCPKGASVAAKLHYE